MSRGPDDVRQALEELCIEAEVRELPDSTRTSPEAAATIGCSVVVDTSIRWFRSRSCGTRGAWERSTPLPAPKAAMSSMIEWA